VVDETANADQVLARAIARAESLASKERATYATIKRGMYGAVIRLLQEGGVS
jgi:hypothetical protein